MSLRKAGPKMGKILTWRDLKCRDHCYSINNSSPKSNTPDCNFVPHAIGFSRVTGSSWLPRWTIFLWRLIEISITTGQLCKLTARVTSRGDSSMIGLPDTSTTRSNISKCSRTYSSSWIASEKHSRTCLERLLAIKLWRQDRWSSACMVTGSNSLTCRTYCQKYAVLHDRWSLMAVVSQDRFHCKTMPEFKTTYWMVKSY